MALLHVVLVNSSTLFSGRSSHSVKLVTIALSGAFLNFSDVVGYVLSRFTLFLRVVASTISPPVFLRSVQLQSSLVTTSCQRRCDLQICIVILGLTEKYEVSSLFP